MQDNTLKPAGPSGRILHSETIKQMRIRHLRDELSDAQIAAEFEVDIEFARAVIKYEIRDESAAMPDSWEYQKTHGHTKNSQYNVHPLRKPTRMRNPFISVDSVKLIRLRHGVGVLRDEDAANWGISVATMRAIINGDICTHAKFYPTAEEYDEFSRRLG